MLVKTEVSKTIINKPEDLERLREEAKKLIGQKVNDQYGNKMGIIKRAEVKKFNFKEASIIIYIEAEESVIMNTMLRNKVEENNNGR